MHKDLHPQTSNQSSDVAFVLRRLTDALVEGEASLLLEFEAAAIIDVSWRYC